jgi:hypothetical protein
MYSRGQQQWLRSAWGLWRPTPHSPRSKVAEAVEEAVPALVPVEVVAGAPCAVAVQECAVAVALCEAPKEHRASLAQMSGRALESLAVTVESIVVLWAPVALTVDLAVTGALA